MATKAYCACGELLRWGEIPNAIEWRLISDVDLTRLFEQQASIQVAATHMTPALRCPRCKRLWIMWDGFGAAPEELVPPGLTTPEQEVPSTETEEAMPRESNTLPALPDMAADSPLAEESEPTYSLVAELFIEHKHYTPALGRLLVDALCAAGFSLTIDPTPYLDAQQSSAVARYHVTGIAVDLSVLDEGARWWAHTMYHASPDPNRPVDILVHIDPSLEAGDESLAYVRLLTGRTHFWIRKEDSALMQQFWAWTMLAVGILQPVYARAGRAEGLLSAMVPDAALVAHTALLPLEWMNIYGPPYIDLLGLEHLLNTPASRVDITAAGAVAITLGLHPYDASAEAAAVATHLGLPAKMGG